MPSLLTFLQPMVDATADAAPHQTQHSGVQAPDTCPGQHSRADPADGAQVSSPENMSMRGLVPTLICHMVV